MDNNKRVVITGIGIISSNAIGIKNFSNAIFNGISGIKPISSFDTSDFKVKTAGEINNFKPEEFLGQKGLRTLDRSTKLICSAAKLALDNGGLEITENNTYDTGVVVATTLGPVKSICDFDKDATTDGVRYVNPAFFPNTVINSPASQVSIKFNIKGFNTTISNGFSAGLDAINYATNFIKLNRAKTILVGAVEDFYAQVFIGFYKSGLLAGLGSGLELSCPFDKRRNGMILGEGSCVLILEDLDSALNRNANIYAEVLGYGMSNYNLEIKDAMQVALEKSNIKTEKIDYICAGANSMQDLDYKETLAIKELFGKNISRQKVSSIKSMVGECFSVSSTIQVAAGLCAIKEQMIPATINYQEKDLRCDLDYVTNKAISHKVENVLINALGPANCSYTSSLTISKFNN